ncbi:MAG: hypothetical protein VKK80_05930 [Prochlorothrix sp.]|nr:hypothetical protein [Prochlorothrix sp.]
MAIFPPSPPSTLHPWLLVWAQREWGRLQGAELQVLLALTQSEGIGSIDSGRLGGSDRQVRSQFIQWLLQLLTIGCNETHFDDFLDPNPERYRPIDRPGDRSVNRSVNRPIDRPSNLDPLERRNLQKLSARCCSLGLRIQDAQLDDRLDLSYWRIPFPLLFQRCQFPKPFSVQGAVLQTLDCTGSQFSIINGNYCQIKGDLYLQQVQVTGDLRLQSIRCRGQLCLDRSRIGGTLTLSQGRIGGSLTLRGVQFGRASLGRATDSALDLAFRVENSGIGPDTGLDTGLDTALNIGPDIALDIGPDIALDTDTAPDIGPDIAPDTAPDTVLEAADLHIGQSLYLQQGFQIWGRGQLTGAQVGQELRIGGGEWRAATGVALEARGLRVRRFSLGLPQEQPLLIVGQVVLAGAEIAETLDSQNCQIRPAPVVESAPPAPVASPSSLLGFSHSLPSGPAPSAQTTSQAPSQTFSPPLSQPFYQPQCLFNGQNLKIQGDLLLHNQFFAEGLVRLTGSWVGGHLICNASRFHNPDRVALDGERLQVAGDVRLRNGLAVAGWVRLNQAQVRGSLILYDIEQPETFKLDLRAAQVGWLQDEARSWPLPGGLRLDGFCYDRLGESAPQDAKSRLTWLRRMPHFCPQPYQHLARVLQTQGRSKAAVAIHLAQLNQGKDLSVWQRFWVKSPFLSRYLCSLRFYLALSLGMVLWGVAVFGQGYRQGVLVPIGAESALEAMTGFESETNLLLPQVYPDFNALAYSLDVFLLGVDLHQESAWLPSPDRGQTLGFLALKLKSGVLLQYYLWFHSLSGYGLTLLCLRALFSSHNP